VAENTSGSCCYILPNCSFDGKGIRSAAVEIAVNGFTKTGIFPLQSSIFDKADFNAEGQREEYHLLDNDQPNGKNFVLPADVSPMLEMLPTASTSGTNISSRHGSAAVITGSAHKQKLLNCMKKKSANHSSGPKKAPATQRKKRTRMSSFQFE
jgi:hypothetical protein